MKRVVLALVSTVASLVMLLSFKTHSTSAVATPPAAVSGTSTTSGSSSGTSSAAPSATPSSTSSASTAAKTYTGSSVDTRYGPVQVQVTVRSGRITTVTAINYPDNDPRDAQINSYAIPALGNEATSANSANIDMISGATYTSQGYISSLQSALDQAGL